MSAAVPAPDRTRPFLPLWAAVLLAAAAGPVTDAAFPDRGWWPLAFVGVAMVLVAAQGRRAGAGFLVGLVWGLTFYLVHIPWMTEFLSPDEPWIVRAVPWFALSLVMALWCGLGTMLISIATRIVPRGVRGPLGRMLFVPLVIGGLWTAREAVSSVWPYGGFAWGRIAESQSDSPIAPLFAWVGISGVGFLMVFLVAVAIASVREAGVAPLLRVGLVTALAALLVAFPAFPLESTGTLRVGAVQGNGKTGYFDRPEHTGDNLLAQYEASAALYDQDVDLVVWPEGGSDLDPLRVPAAARAFDAVAEQAGAPLVGWSVTTRDDAYFNTSLLWRPGKGAVDHYDKRHPVPFGEYVPDRAVWRQFAPELIDLIQREYTPGTTDAVMDVGSDGRSILAAFAICFDIVDDALMREGVEEGGQLVLAQTNNADFGQTDESVQQLAIARIRAIELGRTVVNISTVGASAVILPDGTIADDLTRYTAGVMVVDVPLENATTPAVVIGAGVGWGVAMLGLGALAGQALFGFFAASPRRARR
ncbi:apolipoprotein N-acyltransferase [Protaetiibacter intestinalis]|uniref:Apolipoprotein N-acyltransferase n=1 Tax=Protaetiibacter intestinalis TaxID=2419774 RepID=A0A387BD37_9MICO|nr:apolipoprotein N-acyltransferase [Protaetiibacter intestinalis]AYF99005.1 apolipoprotein N-acyltransferase [Protaetiibacter intestinalis]